MQKDVSRQKRNWITQIVSQALFMRGWWKMESRSRFLSANHLPDTGLFPCEQSICHPPGFNTV